MPDSSPLHFESEPQLRSPYLVAAFAGWNDAAQVATHALESLVDGWNLEPFADIDPEEFYDFSNTRPTISLGTDGQRDLEWPDNLFFARQLLGTEHDLILLVGNEPQLRWRTFTDLILHVADTTGARCLVTLGGLLADVPHTITPRLTGFSSGEEGLPTLQDLGLKVSSYEGPTGIVGVLHDAWRLSGRPAISLWGNVPHYISAAPNPQISLALLRRLQTILRVPMPFGPLELQEQAFIAQVNEALKQNPEAQEYVQELETQYVEEAPPPPGPELIAELEKFLRKRRPDGTEGPEGS
jgi:proteasome assembly chaperone (PAC2) family protein